MVPCRSFVGDAVGRSILLPQSMAKLDAKAREKGTATAMFSESKRLLLCVVAVLLLLAAVWTLNLTVFNLWISTGPPVQHPEMYRTRGLLFLGISMGLGIALIVTCWRLWRVGRTHSQEDVRKAIH